MVVRVSSVHSLKLFHSFFIFFSFLEGRGLLVFKCYSCWNSSHEVSSYIPGLFLLFFSVISGQYLTHRDKLSFHSLFS